MDHRNLVVVAVRPHFSYHFQRSEIIGQPLLLRVQTLPSPRQTIESYNWLAMLTCAMAVGAIIHRILCLV